MELINKKDFAIQPPKGGWIAQSWYLVNVAYSTTNPIHRAILFTGFLNNGNPSGYSFLTPANGGGDITALHEAKYIKPIKLIYTYKIEDDS